MTVLRPLHLIFSMTLIKQNSLYFEGQIVGLRISGKSFFFVLP